MTGQLLLEGAVVFIPEPWRTLLLLPLPSGDSFILRCADESIVIVDPVCETTAAKLFSSPLGKFQKGEGWWFVARQEPLLVSPETRLANAVQSDSEQTENITFSSFVQKTMQHANQLRGRRLFPDGRFRKYATPFHPTFPFSLQKTHESYQNSMEAQHGNAESHSIKRRKTVGATHPRWTYVSSFIDVEGWNQELDMPLVLADEWRNLQTEEPLEGIRFTDAHGRHRLHAARQFDFRCVFLSFSKPTLDSVSCEEECNELFTSDEEKLGEENCMAENTFGNFVVPTDDRSGLEYPDVNGFSSSNAKLVDACSAIPQPPPVLKLAKYAEAYRSKVWPPKKCASLPNEISTFSALSEGGRPLQSNLYLSEQKRILRLEDASVSIVGDIDPPSFADLSHCRNIYEESFSGEWTRDERSRRNRIASSRTRIIDTVEYADGEQPVFAKSVSLDVRLLRDGFVLASSYGGKVISRAQWHHQLLANVGVRTPKSRKKPFMDKKEESKPLTSRNPKSNSTMEVRQKYSFVAYGLDDNRYFEHEFFQQFDADTIRRVFERWFALNPSVFQRQLLSDWQSTATRAPTLFWNLVRHCRSLPSLDHPVFQALLPSTLRTNIDSLMAASLCTRPTRTSRTTTGSARDCYAKTADLSAIDLYLDEMRSLKEPIPRRGLSAAEVSKLRKVEEEKMRNVFLALCDAARRRTEKYNEKPRRPLPLGVNGVENCQRNSLADGDHSQCNGSSSNSAVDFSKLHLSRRERRKTFSPHTDETALRLELVDEYLDEDGFPRRQLQFISDHLKRLLYDECCLRGYWAPMELSMDSVKGRTVRSACFICKDDFVCEYRGELISNPQEAKRRELEYERAGKGSFMYYFENPFSSKSCCIDSTEEYVEYGPGRLFNHSKANENLGTMAIRSIVNEPKIVFFARRNIAKGEELLFDYKETDPAVLQKNPWLRY